MTAGEAVKAVREAADMTQVEFAREIGLKDHSRVGQVERGRGSFRHRTIQRLCKRFRKEMRSTGVTPYDFVCVGEAEG